MPRWLVPIRRQLTNGVEHSCVRKTSDYVILLIVLIVGLRDLTYLRSNIRIIRYRNLTFWAVVDTAKLHTNFMFLTELYSVQKLVFHICRGFMTSAWLQLVCVHMRCIIIPLRSFVQRSAIFPFAPGVQHAHNNNAKLGFAQLELTVSKPIELFSVMFLFPCDITGKRLLTIITSIKSRMEIALTAWEFF
jgi:hypothetical protein